MEALEFFKLFMISKYSFLLASVFFLFFLTTKRRDRIEGLLWMLSFSFSAVAFIFSVQAKILANERLKVSLNPEAQFWGDFFNFFVYFSFFGSIIIIISLIIVAVIRQRKINRSAAQVTAQN